MRFYRKSATSETPNRLIQVSLNLFWYFPWKSSLGLQVSLCALQCWLSQKLVMDRLLFRCRENGEQKPEKHPLLHHVHSRGRARAQSRFWLFTCKSSWKVAPVGDECFYRRVIMSLHINSGPTRPSCSLHVSLFFFFFPFRLEIVRLSSGTRICPARRELTQILTLMLALSSGSLQRAGGTFHSVWLRTRRIRTRKAFFKFHKWEISVVPQGGGQYVVTFSPFSGWATFCGDSLWSHDCFPPLASWRFHFNGFQWAGFDFFFPERN